MGQKLKGILGHTRRLVLTLLVLVLAAGIGLAASADTAGPSLSGLSPEPNTDITAKYPNFNGTGYITIEYLATDADNINSSSVQVKLNGNLPYSKTVTFAELSGHWQDDEDGYGPYWVVDSWDYTRATVKATFFVTNLPEANTVWTSVSDQAGNNTTTQYNFTYNKPPVVSNQSPANGSSAYSNFPTIQAKVTDNGAINTASIAMTIDGAPIAHTFNTSNGYVTATPASPLTAGRHDVVLRVSDMAGNSQTASWFFNIPQGTATFSEATPAYNGTANVWNPTISVFVSDTSNLSGSKYMVVNGSKVNASFAYLVTGGHWEWVDYGEGPEEVWITEYDFTKGALSYKPDMLPDGPITASASIANSSGIPSLFNWSFDVKAPPLAANKAPTGYVNTGTPTVSAKLTDNSAINADSIVLKIDNTVLNHTFDPATGIVSGTPTVSLSGGDHTVYLEAADNSGNKDSTTWSFNVPSGNMAFSAPLPAGGSTLNVWNPDICINVTDIFNLDPNSATISVNGNPVSASFAYKVVGGHWEWFDDGDFGYDIWVDDYDYTKGVISGKPAMLTDGANTITATMKNVYGFPTSYSWSINVSAPPQVSNPSPATEVRQQQPLISAKVTENSTVSSIRILVDGVEIPSSYDASTTTASGTPPTPLADDATHNVQVTATDGLGLSGSLSWSFYINTFDKMPVTGNCADCHSNFPVPNHPMNDCNGCHSNNQPVEDCRSCHGGYGHGPEMISGWSCNQCHNSTYSYKIPLHPADNDAYHNTAQAINSCTPCHTKSLTREHYRRTDDATGQPLTCNTCHASTNAQVQQAIANRDKNCTSCHGQAGHEELHITTNVLDNKCITCHKDSLTQEHLNNPATQTDKISGQLKPWNCDTCHNSANQKVTGALAISDKQCAACHREAHNFGLAAKAPPDIPLYSGLKWTNPTDAFLFKNEAWLPQEFVPGGKIMVAKRSATITGDAVWSYYAAQMPANGWTLTTPAPTPGANYYSATFTKGTRKAILWFYGGENHKATPLQSGGYRVEIIYR